MGIRELSPELAKIARDELNEVPERINDDLRSIKEWLNKQPHLRARTDDQWLVAILRGCKYSLELVKKKLDLYYTLKTTASDVTLRIRPTDPKFIEFLRLGTCLILPQSKDGLHPRVILIRAGMYDPAINSVADIMCILYYLVQIVVMEDDAASIVGTKIVTDYTGVSMNHLIQATPGLLKKMVAVSQDSLPLRLKGSHHVNVPTGIEIIFTLIRGFLNEKAKQRLKIHKTNEDLLQHLPADVVPEEYGGSGGSIAEITEYWVKKIQEYQPWMQEEERLGSDESKRPGKEAKSANDGSFRKLDID